jgi:hypothetical protein
MDPANWLEAGSLAAPYVGNVSAAMHFPIKAVGALP